jgi:hypothetical protein
MHYTSFWICPHQYTCCLTDENMGMYVALFHSLVTMSSPPYFYDSLTTRRLDTSDWELNFNARVIFQSFRTTNHLPTSCKGHVFLLVCSIGRTPFFCRWSWKMELKGEVGRWSGEWSNYKALTCLGRKYTTFLVFYSWMSHT